ncbi:MAG: SPOR domain-containing protein [Deltaproteobacteria bacterium]|nr:SPOR domain-containing protein [Deltaproteobacteria bacterium]
MNLLNDEKTPKALGKREIVWIGIGNLFLMILSFSIGFWMGEEEPAGVDSDSSETSKVPSFAPPVPSVEEDSAVTSYSFYKTLEQKRESVSPLETGKPAMDSMAQDLLFTVQVGAYQDQRAAENLKSSLKSKGYSVYTEEGSFSGGSKIYRVRVGKYKEREKAQMLAIQLEKEERLATFVTLVNP